MNKTGQKLSFAIVCLIGFLMGFGSSVAETLVTKYAETLGALPGAIGVVSSVCSISALLVLPISAPLLDAYNKKWIYFASASMLAIAYVGFAFSHSVNALIFFRLVNGIGKGVANAVCMAMASDVLSDEKKTQGVVYCSLAMAISMAFAPSAGLFISNHYGYFVLFIFSAVIIAVTMALAMLVKTPKGTGKIRISLSSMIARGSIQPAVLMLFLATAYSVVNSFVVVYATGMDISDIGIYFTVYSLVLLVSRPLVTKLSKKIPMTLIMIPAMLFFALSMYLISISRNITMFVISAIVAAFGYGVCQPLVQAMCIEKAGEGKSGVGSSTSFIGTNVGYFVGPYVGGLIAEKSGYPVMFRYMIVPVVLGAILLMYMNRKEVRK